MLEAGHTAIALEKGPGIGGVFCRTHDAQYDNLYLTISNLMMAFSDFPPEELRLEYSSKEEYGAYLETSYRIDPFNVMAFAFSLMQAPVEAVMPRESGLRGRWAFEAKRYLLHGNA